MYTQKTHTKAHLLYTFLPRVRAHNLLVIEKSYYRNYYYKKRLKIAERIHMQSYEKLRKLKKETEFILTTEKRKLEKMLHKENGSVDTVTAYALALFQELFELYEIE